jgi:magnesium transporter
MTAAIITKADSPYPQTSSITFILHSSYLVTIRYISPTSFINFSSRLIRNPKKFTTSNLLLEGLLEDIITRVAHNSEVVAEELDKLSHDIFGVDAFDTTGGKKSTSLVMKQVLRQLGTCADLNSKISESLHSLSRLVCYFRQVHNSDKDLDDDIAILSTDVSALLQQTGFLGDKITFQLEATLGMINVEQNLIIKIFSVVAVFFMPPTLISSLYGMNFNIPELHWEYGYAYALTMMIIVAVIPYIYFRRKGWM